MFRKIGYLLIVGALVAAIGELLALKLPTLRWGFETSREIAWLHWNAGTAACLGIGNLRIRKSG